MMKINVKVKVEIVDEEFVHARVETVELTPGGLTDRLIDDLVRDISAKSASLRLEECKNIWREWSSRKRAKEAYNQFRKIKGPEVDK